MASSASHPLRHAPFVWFWLAQSISLLGDRVYSVALPFLVLELGGSAAQIGQVLAVYSVPQLLFLLTGGVLVDRAPRRLTMLVSNALHALLLGVVLVLMLSGRLELTHLYALSGLFGLLSAFFMPAAMSITPQLVPREVLPQANALRSLASELAGILGPPLGGVLVTLGSLSLALGFDALTFVLGALCLLATRPRPVKRQTEATPSGYWRDLGEGFRYVAGSRWLWVTIVLFSFVNIFVAGVTVVLLPLLAASRFAGARVARLAVVGAGRGRALLGARAQPLDLAASGLDGLSRRCCRRVRTSRRRARPAHYRRRRGNGRCRLEPHRVRRGLGDDRASTGSRRGAGTGVQPRYARVVCALAARVHSHRLFG